MQGVRRVLGKLANERGAKNEDRVVEACALPARPPWLLSARKATRAEDAQGIDVVIESDVGKLFVQVKSSRGGKARFVERGRAHVAVVVVTHADSSEKVLRKVVGEVSRLRAQYLKLRG